MEASINFITDLKKRGFHKRTFTTNDKPMTCEKKIQSCSFGEVIRNEENNQSEPQTERGKNGEDFMKCDDSNLQQIMDYVNLTITKQTQILKDVLNKSCQGTIIYKCIEDVAYKKQTGQSSTLLNSYDYSSSNGVDGLLPSGDEPMIHTNTEKNPFWWVNLGKEYLVERVEIWNRKDCCAERTRNMDITVGSTLNDMKLCAHYKGPSQKGEQLILGCTKRRRGRYVKLQIQGTVALNLLEVKVFAFKTCSN